LDRRIFTIFLIVFVNFLGATIVIPTLPLYAQERFEAPPEQVTLLIASFFAAQLVAAPFLGRLSDRYGRLPVLLISQLGTVISFVMMGVAQNMGVMFAARILDGLTGGNIIVAQAYITDITPPEQRTRALGIAFAAFGLGFIFGPGLGGGLSAVLGDQAPFWAGAAVTMLTVIITWLTLDESLTPDKRREIQARPQARMRPADVLGNTALVLVLLVGFGAQFSFSLFQSTFSLFSEAVLFDGYSKQETHLGIGILLSAVGIGQFVTQLVLIQPLVRRLGERWMVILGTGLRAFGVLSMTVLTSPWLVGPVSLLTFAVGSGIMMPSLQSLATTSAADEIRGGVLGVYQSATSLGIILGSALAGVLFGIAPTMPFLVGGTLFVLMLMPGFALLRYGRRQAVMTLGDQA
jgi:DHA1 family tetracycline resistance protein-like MFS transporter